MKITQYVYFKLNKNISEEDFLNESQRFNDDYVSKQEGYVSRQILKFDDSWVDLTIWKDYESAKKVEETLMTSKAAKKFLMMMDMSTVQVKRFEIYSEY